MSSKNDALPVTPKPALELHNHSTSTLATLATQHAAVLAAATSDNTRRAYRSAIRHFLDWGGVLPADEASLIRYLMHYAQQLNPRTLALRLTALSQWHAQQGFADPAASVTVRKTLTGISRLHGRPQNKAKAIAIENIEKIVSCLAASGTVKAIRDNALLQIGFFGGYRRSELAGLQLEHVRWESQGIVITLPRSKTDQIGQGIIKAIPYGTGICSPPRALKTWLETAAIHNGALFRSIDKWGVIGSKGLHESSINAILKHSAILAGLEDGSEFSSHSLRRGMATSAHRAGANFRDIKRQGGWRHDGTVQGYIDEADQFSNNAANTLLNSK